MRVLVLALVLVLWGAVAPDLWVKRGPAYAAADATYVPGQSIGSVRIGMSMEDAAIILRDG